MSQAHPQLLRGMAALSNWQGASIVTIGNFDGVHLGHQTLLKHLLEKSQHYNLPSVVLLFEPQPMEHFLGAKAPLRLQHFTEKFMDLQALGVDSVACLHFNHAFSQISAADFVKHILVESLHIRYLSVGDDFRFGFQRQGDFAYLEQCSRDYGFELESQATVSLSQQRVSSTRVRDNLILGRLDEVTRLLGHPYGVYGKVNYGQQKGRSIGFPTINLPMNRRRCLVKGVYAVNVSWRDKVLHGVANVGTRPTVAGSGILLEVHLFNFNRDIYGERVRVEFIQKLREEKRFASFDELKAQIERDAEAARAVFWAQPEKDT